MDKTTCIQCGNTFRGRPGTCAACLATDRTCAACGRPFRGRYLRCHQCRRTPRTCDVCGTGFSGNQRVCRACRLTERNCENCGSAFRGDMTVCRTCSGTERTCTGCGERFTGVTARCWRCRAGEKPCAQCGRPVRASNALCSACRTAGRPCVTCGKTFRGRTRECKVCSGQSLADGHARRARKLAAQVAGPLPRSVYREILASGTCVYCGAAADTVDHVRPLSRGGHEAAYNLVAACGYCNFGKRDRLLTEWDPVRVARAVAHSPAVAAELERELADHAGAAALHRPGRVPRTLD